MNHTQKLVIKRLQRLVRDAKKAELILVADADAMAIRVIKKEDYKDADDLRELGETVELESGCGGAHYAASGSAVGSIS